MSTNENTPLSQKFWDRMQEYWHSNRSFPPAHPDWRKKADLIDGKVPAGQLPSYVDDVLEFDTAAELPQPGEKGKIYITTADNRQFRWSGSDYIVINPDENAMMLNSEQAVTGRKYFITSNGSDVINQKLWLRSFDGSDPAAVYHKDGYGSGTLGFDGREFRFTGAGNTAYAYLTVKGIRKERSNDEYLLTGGGGHVLKQDLGLSHTHQHLLSGDTGTVDANTLLKDYYFTYHQKVDRKSGNMFPAVNDANSVISIASHPGGYGAQIGFNDDQGTFIRSAAAGRFSPWKQLAYRDWVSDNYLPLTGGSLSGDLSLQVLKSNLLTGRRIMEAGSSNRLYFGNPVVEEVYHETGKKHVFSNKGNVSFTIDGSGNVNAENAINAGNDSEIRGRLFGKRTLIDASGLDESRYYPVTVECSSSYPSTIKVYRTLDASMGIPSYATHHLGFWCYYEFEVYGNGWGVTPLKAICRYQDETWVKNGIKVIGYDQMAFSSNAVIYVRGGSRYNFDINTAAVPVLRSSSYAVYGQSVEPVAARIWSGGIAMNASTDDIQQAVAELDFNPELKADRENNAVGIGFEAGLISSPYMKHHWGVAHLATKSWTDAGFVPNTHPAAGISQARINGWDNSVSRLSASEEIILEDDTLKIRPEEFSLEGSSDYQIASKRSRVHVLFREGSDLNILKLVRRQTMVIFNFEKGPVAIIPEGFKPYSLPSQAKVTLYVSDTDEVLFYNESSFKKAD